MKIRGKKIITDQSSLGGVKGMGNKSIGAMGVIEG